jgi:hypothetical protein
MTPTTGYVDRFEDHLDRCRPMKSKPIIECGEGALPPAAAGLFDCRALFSKLTVSGGCPWTTTRLFAFDPALSADPAKVVVTVPSLNRSISKKNRN